MPVISVVWDDDIVANLKARDGIADTGDVADGFVAETVGYVGRAAEAVVHVEVGAADGGGGDADDDICLVDDGGNGHVDYGDVVGLAEPGYGSHC